MNTSKYLKITTLLSPSTLVKGFKMKALNFYKTSNNRLKKDFDKNTHLYYDNVNIILTYRDVVYGTIAGAEVLVYNNIIICERGKCKAEHIDMFFDKNLFAGTDGVQQYFFHDRPNKCYQDAINLLKLKGIKL
jgi:hypothetical protein